MIGAYACVWGLVTGLAPVVVALAGLHDLLRRNRWALLRLVGLMWVLLAAELMGVCAAAAIWARHVLARGRDHDAFLVDNYRLQQWWARLLLGSASRLLQLRFTIQGDAQAVPGPVVVLMRHTSILDTILPVVLLGARHGMRLRYVLKAGLQLDPCLDIVGHRLPNYFVDRAGDTAIEVEAVARLAEDLGPHEGVLIYPEGTRFTPRKLERARARLAQRDPQLHALAVGLERVLPPRPKGTLALLDRALPQGADVVFFAHAGLERLVRLHDVLSGAAIGTHVQVKIWRVAGAEVPADRDGRLRWIYARWHEVDAHARQTALVP